jgi:hypothetical protein
MTTIDTRLLKLEATFRPKPGCDACHRWRAGETVVCDGRDRPDSCTRPDTCGQCGRSVPYGSRLVITGIDMRDI